MAGQASDRAPSRSFTGFSRGRIDVPRTVEEKRPTRFRPPEVVARWARAEKCAHSWPCQLVLFVMSLAPCVAYGLGKRAAGEYPLFIVLLFAVVEVPLLLLNLAEMVIQVGAQVGPPHVLSSWSRVLRMTYNKLQAFVVALMVLHVVFGALVVVDVIRNDFQDLDGEDRTVLAYQATLVFMLLFRSLRTWAIFFDISVAKSGQTKTRFLQELMEYKADKERSSSIKIEALLDSFGVQTFVFVLSLAHCIAYTVTVTEAGETMELVYGMTKWSGYILLLVFCSEFSARCAAQGGENFFRPSLHKVELTFVVLSMAWLFVMTWFHAAISQWKSLRVEFGVGLLLILLAHRGVRFLEIRFRVSAHAWDAQTIASAHAMQIFSARFGDLIEVAPDNLRMLFVNSYIEVHIKRALLKPQALRELHLPLEVHGGMVDDLRFRVQWLPLGGKRKEVPSTLLHVRNMMLLVGPGPGLAEAGGFAPAEGGHWTPDNVRTAKAKLVTLICSRLKPPKDDEQPKRRIIGSFFANRVQRASSVIKERSMNHVELEISNATFRYEDVDGRLGYGQPVVISAKVGRVSAMRKAGQSFRCQLARIGIVTERGSDIWGPASLSPFFTKNPQKLLEDLIHQNCAERLRAWSLEGLDHEHPFLLEGQRHRRTELWPGKRQIATLLYVNIVAGPQKSWLSENDEGEDDEMHLERMQLVSARRLDKPKKQKSLALTKRRSPNEPEDHSWEWHITSQPVRVNIDETQARCLRTFVKSAKAWQLYDRAFMRRPITTIEEVKDNLYNVAFRRSTVKAWWSYAMHRVLACRGLRPRTIWLDEAWRSANYRRYAMHLEEIGRRHALERSGSAFQLAPLVPEDQAEKRVLEDLQVCLPMADIIRCYRRGLLEARKARQNRNKHLRRKVSLESMQSAVTDMSARTHESLGSVENAVVTKIAALEGAHDSLADELTKRLEQPVKRSWFCFKRKDVAKQDEDPDEAADATEEQAEEEEDEAGGQEENDIERPLHEMLAGEWQFHMPLIEVRLLHNGARPRKVLLHGLVRHMLGEAGINMRTTKLERKLDDDASTFPSNSGPEAATQPGLGAGGGTSSQGTSSFISAGTQSTVGADPSTRPETRRMPRYGWWSMTVDSFSVSAADEGKHMFGAGRHLVTVTQPLRLDWHLCQNRGSGWQEVAFGARAKWVAQAPRRRSSQQGGVESTTLVEAPGAADTNQGILEVHLGDVHMQVSEVLMRMLRAFGEPFRPVDPLDPKFEEPPLVVRRRLGCGNLVVSSGRMGPFKSSAFTADSTQAQGGDDMHYRAERAHKNRIERQRKWRTIKAFETVTKMFEERSREWDVDLNIGSIHMQQLGKFSRNTVLVEEMYQWPVVGRLCRKTTLDLPQDWEQGYSGATKEHRLSASCGPAPVPETQESGQREAFKVHMLPDDDPHAAAMLGRASSVRSDFSQSCVQGCPVQSLDRLRLPAGLRCGLAEEEGQGSQEPDVVIGPGEDGEVILPLDERLDPPDVEVHHAPFPECIPKHVLLSKGASKGSLLKSQGTNGDLRSSADRRPRPEDEEELPGVPGLTESGGQPLLAVRHVDFSVRVMPMDELADHQAYRQRQRPQQPRTSHRYSWRSIGPGDKGGKLPDVDRYEAAPASPKLSL